MLTLVRPIKSQVSDQIEQRLKDMVAAYQVIYKEVSSIPYLIETGRVFAGKAITGFLDEYQRELNMQRSISADACETDPETGEVC